MQVAFALSKFPFVSLCDKLFFRDTLHPGENLPHQLVDDFIQNVYGVARLPGAFGLLAELAIAGIADTQGIVQ